MVLGIVSLGREWAWAEGPETGTSDGTRRMAERLEKIATTADPLRNPFLNRRSAEIYRQQLARLKAATDLTSVERLQKQVPLQFKYAVELLNSGESLQASDEFRSLQQLIAENRVELSVERHAIIRDFLVLSMLRLGEQENCRDHHNAASCLFPIRPAGVHVLQRGSRGAIQLLLEDLGRKPDLRQGWLLNLAYMTLGEYPDRVPAAFRIDPKVFESEHDIRVFADRAHELGLDLPDVAGSVVAEDFDRDGDLDLMICSMGLRDPLRYFENDGSGGFVERTREAGLTGLVGGLNLAQADYDNDGYVDVLVLRGAWFEKEGHHPNSLIRNRGNGTFEDVTERAGLLSFHPTQAATWLDFNNDGWVDVFIGNETSAGDTHSCELFRNNGDGTFTDVAVESGITATGMVKAVHSGDYDNDGLTDLYLSLRGQPNFLYRNLGPTPPAQLRVADRKASKAGWQFQNVARELGVREPINSFPAWFFDYDNDGWLDLYVSAFAAKDVGQFAADYLGLPHNRERQRLYRNNRRGGFEDVTRAVNLWQAPLPMSGNFGDLDNDGWLDFYLGTGTPDLSMLVPNRMYRNDGGKRFQDVTTSGGFGHLQKGHGIAFADLDNDGDQDVYVSMGGAYEGDFYANCLFENPGHGGRWLKLWVEGTRSNRAAIGARVRVRVRGEDGEARELYRDVNSGGCFGASPLRREIGLGQARSVEEVEVWWPATGKRQRWTGFELDQAYRLEEGSDRVERLALKRSTFHSKTAGSNKP